MSSFQGLEVARKALFAQQNALYTTGHNIANVNTEGYSRQRVNFAASTPFPVPSRVQPQIPGQLGTGVNIESVQRIRNKFLDAQFRTEHSRLGYWDTRLEALTRMENLLNEPSETGLSNRMDLFWQSLQDLADHPENTGARAVVAQRGLALAETFNYFSRSLGSIREDLKSQILISVDEDTAGGTNITSDINLLLKNINELNKKIQEIEPHGFLANDLYDERDRLIDDLSNYMNIKVTYRKSSESPLELEIADGIASIELLQSDSQSFNPPILLIDAGQPNDSLENAVNFLEVTVDDTHNAVSEITLDGQNILSQILQSDGRLSALVETFGYLDNGEVKGDYPEMLAELDRMARALAEEFNRQHQAGRDMNGDAGLEFFVVNDGSTEITAGNITVNEQIIKDSRLITAGHPDYGSRNGENALQLAGVFDRLLTDLDDASVRSFYIALIGEMGVKTQEADTMSGTTEILESHINHSRMSVSAVSLDEEISNLIKFQHAYNAAARNMTAIDELIDRIINHMGLVGR